MEATSGIAALTLSDGAVKVEPTVDGSFGAFTVAGATKGRMVYSRGKVYAGCGQKVIIIDPATDQIIKSIPFEGHQIKGIAKGADGNIYCPLAATYTGSLYSPTFTSSPKMVALDHDGNVLSETDMPDEIELPIASWSPSVGFCASFTQLILCGYRRIQRNQCQPLQLYYTELRRKLPEIQHNDLWYYGYSPYYGRILGRTVHLCK